MHWCEGIRCLGTRVIDSCKIQYWELNLGVLQEQSMFLTAEP